MRTCCRCQSEMLDGFMTKVKGNRYGISIKIGEDNLLNEEEIKMALCPNCGEVSFYIKNIEKVVGNKTD